MEDTPCTYRLSVKAVIKDGDKVLLIREDDDTWELPGGGLEHDENPRQGLAREIAEETGYTVGWVSKSPLAFWTCSRQAATPSGVKWFGFVAYEARISGAFKPGADTNDAAQEAQYFSRSEAKELNLHENTKPYFSDAQ